MDLRSPSDWVDARADIAADDAALVFIDGVVTYGQLATEIARRADSVRSEWGSDTQRMVPVPVRLDLPSIVEVLAHQKAGLVPVPQVDPIPIPDVEVSGAVLVVPTSGTSGARRLVPLTMANLATSAQASRRRLATGPDDRWLLSLPIDHIGGLSVLFRSFEAGGAAIVGPFDDRLPQLARRGEPTIASLVPTMVHRLLGTDPELLASVGTVLVGGARLPWGIVERAEEAGVRIAATYGSTETSSQVATTQPGEALMHPGFVGRPLDGFDVTIPNPDPSGAGRIAVDGAAVFGGYVGEEPRTGAFVTSDIGRFDDAGRLTVIGRADDVVVTGGLNVALPVVEDAIGAIDGVDAVAVVGLDDDEWGTAVAALVSSGRSVDAIREELRAGQPGHLVPRRWRAGTIPLLANGKPDVAAIRRMFE